LDSEPDQQGCWSWRNEGFGRFLIACSKNTRSFSSMTPRKSTPAANGQPHGLNDIQVRILEFIQTEHARDGVFPSIREIANHMNFGSTNTVDYHLRKMEALGAIRRPGRKARSYAMDQALKSTLTPRESSDQEARGARSQGIPLLGRVAAGEPILAEQNFEDYVKIESWFRTDDSSFALRVRGDSMIDAGIEDGDLVIVRSQPRVDNGQIGVAVLGDEATVKRIYDEGDRWRLQPENPQLEPRFVTKSEGGFRIAGKVVGVLRKV
jgi:repressor LexA